MKLILPVSLPVVCLSVRLCLSVCLSESLFVSLSVFFWNLSPSPAMRSTLLLFAAAFAIVTESSHADIQSFVTRNGSQLLLNGKVSATDERRRRVCFLCDRSSSFALFPFSFSSHGGSQGPTCTG